MKKTAELPCTARGLDGVQFCVALAEPGRKQLCAPHQAQPSLRPQMLTPAERAARNPQPRRFPATLWDDEAPAC